MVNSDCATSYPKRIPLLLALIAVWLFGWLMLEDGQTTSLSVLGEAPNPLRLPFPHAKADNGDIVVHIIDL